MARFIVTGTPRSATGYASLLFRELAIPCTHERIFKPRGALADVLSWYEYADAGEASWLAWAFLGLLPGKVPVLRTTRNPWAVIDSLAHRNDLIPKDSHFDRGKKLMRDAIASYCPEVNKYDAPIDRAVAFIVRWDALIAKAVGRYRLPYHAYRVEDMDEAQLTGILEFLGLYRDAHEIKSALAVIPRNVNGGGRIQRNVKVTDPRIVEVMERMAPGHEAIIDTLKSADVARTPDELEEHMAPRLRDELGALALRQGYDRNAVAAVPQEKEGVQTHGT